MNVKGKKTTIEQVDVIIDPSEVLGKIYASSIPRHLSHISNGYWYKLDGYDYHKREELYEKDRMATDEEIAFREAYLTIMKFIKEKNL